MNFRPLTTQFDCTNSPALWAVIRGLASRWLANILRPPKISLWDDFRLKRQDRHESYVRNL